MNRMAGRIVKIKSGKLGRTFKHEGMINGKVPVYPLSGDSPHGYLDKPMLCDPTTLKTKAYID